MGFCPENSSLVPIWVNHGLSRCFMETLISSVMFFIVVVLGGIQILVFWKRALRRTRRFRTNPFWFRLQIFLSIAMITQYILRIVMYAVFDEPLSSDIELATCFYIASYIVSFFVIAIERTKFLGNQVHGHGFILLLFWSLAFLSENLAFISWGSPHYLWKLDTQFHQTMFGLWLVRYVITFCLFVLGLRAPGLPKKSYMLIINEDAEDPIEKTPPSIAENHSTWANIVTKVRILWPYIYPKGSFLPQLYLLVCVLMMIAGRVITVYIPILSKNIVEALSRDPPLFPVRYIMYYLGCRVLQGSGGKYSMFTSIRFVLWVRIKQYTMKGLKARLLDHLHNLSYRWHQNRNTGEVLRMMDRGTQSTNEVFGYIVFDILPTFADLFIAVVYFYSALSALFGLIMFLALTIFIIGTIALTEWRTKFRRRMNIKDNIVLHRATDSLLNFETVKHYNNESFEVDRYRESITDFQLSEWHFTLVGGILGFFHNFIVSGCLLICSMLCAHYICEGNLKVGDYVLFATYFTQLYNPLTNLSSFYVKVQEILIDIENMIDLFEEKKEIKDDPDACDLIINNKKLEFDNVSFYYNKEKPILHNVSFAVEPGQTLAIVGPSGSGKSTIIRLMMRFYEPTDGHIRLDGQDISKVTQSSLRCAIGVVPQDTILFNDNIRYNIRYGNMHCALEEMEEAAKSADIHVKIKSFHKGYDTMVGERAVKLSGGEKQRVAIARTILKDPDFIILDEATSALDHETEENIQRSLSYVCEDKTTIVVAHRPSTV
nr:ATP-binding cassette sub-family B member 6-like [Lytechinus pictus]